MSRSEPTMYNETKTVFWVVLKNHFDNFDDFCKLNNSSLTHVQMQKKFNISLQRALQEQIILSILCSSIESIMLYVILALNDLYK